MHSQRFSIISSSTTQTDRVAPRNPPAAPPTNVPIPGLTAVPIFAPSAAPPEEPAIPAAVPNIPFATSLPSPSLIPLIDLMRPPAIYRISTALPPYF